MTDYDIAGAVGLLLLVLAAVVFFWLWSRHNEKATVQRIKKYQAPLEENAPPGQGISVPPPVTGADSSADMSRDLSEQIVILNRLLGAADEQAARLERAIEEAKRLGKYLGAE